MKRRSRERERQVAGSRLLDYPFRSKEGERKEEARNWKFKARLGNNGQDFKSLNPMSSFFSSGWKAKYAASSAITKYKDWKNRKI